MATLKNKTRRYKSPRRFVALTKDGKRECLTSSSNQPTKAYIVAMVGPFRTKRAQVFYRSNPGIFLRNVSQAESLAREVASL